MFCLLFGLLVGDALALDIQVSPAVLVLKARGEGDSVSIHTDVPYSAVTGCGVTVNGTDVAVTATFADSCGNLVVKCSRVEVAEVVKDVDMAEFSLTVGLADGGSASATDSVVVKR